MDIDDQSPVLVVPGWGGSGPDHWQTYWQHDLGAPRVELEDWFCPHPAAWLAALDNGLASLARRDPRPPVLVAHSLGCIAVAHWSRRPRRAIRAAFLVAPADVERSPSLERLGAFGPIPTHPLPFSSLVVASDDDPHIEASRAEAFALRWGSQYQLITRGGHLNAASKLGHWPDGRALLARLLQRTQLSRSA